MGRRQQSVSFATDLLGERKRGQATADYDSNSIEELSLMSYEVSFLSSLIIVFDAPHLNDTK